MLQGYDVEVGLSKVTPNPEELIEEAGRLCYATEGKVGTTPGWIQARIRAGHESILEHASATFYIRCSRVVTHELVRHRIASYSQRSQRFVTEDEPRYITPPELQYPEKGSDDRPSVNARLFIQVMELCWKTYGELLRVGVKPEVARYVLPNACETQIVCTWNFRELRHIIKLRTSPAALPEMRAVAGEIREICKMIAPQVFEDL